MGGESVSKILGLDKEVRPVKMLLVALLVVNVVVLVVLVLRRR